MFVCADCVSNWATAPRRPRNAGCGWAYHHDVDRFRRDRQRQNSLVALGWTVLRFTWADLTQRPAYVLATVRDLGALKSTG
jgi:hypothetical protein